MLKNERKYEVGEGVGLLKFLGKVDFWVGVERTGGFFILSRPSPFPYLVNTWSPFWEKKKNQNLWPYISIFYCPTFISGQILPGIFGHLAPVVQKLDSTIHRINLYPVDSAIGFPNTYPLDSNLSGG